MDEFDDDYVRRLGEGDRETEEHFSLHFRRSLTGKLFHKGVSRSEADDIIQETLLRTLKIVRSEAVRDGKSLPGLVNSICENVLKEWWRAGKRTESLDDNVVDFPSADRSPLDELIRDENAKLARAILADLQPKDAAILRALFIDERDKDAICREHGVDRGYLRVLLFRAKQRFREVMKRKPPRRH